MTEQEDWTYVVIIPSSGRSETLLARAIRSAASQSPPPTKIYVVDDSSNQNLDVDQLEGANNVQMIRSGGAVGGGAARNLAIRDHLASFSGDEKHAFVFFLDDDDEWLEGKVSTQFDAIRNVAVNIDVVASLFKTHHNVTSSKQPNSSLLKDELLLSNCRVSPSTIGITVAAMRALGGFNETLQAWQGRDLFIRMYLDGMNVLRVNDVLVFQDQSHGLNRISDSAERRHKAARIVLDNHRPRLGAYAPYLDWRLGHVHTSGVRRIIAAWTRGLPRALRIGRPAILDWGQLQFIVLRDLAFRARLAVRNELSRSNVNEES